MNSPISPCGICLQVIREFCAPEMPILLVPGNYYYYYQQILDSVQEVQSQRRCLSEDGLSVKEIILGELFPETF